MANNKVKFKFGTLAQYNALATATPSSLIDEHTLYFITDKKLVFKGSTLYGHVVSTETTGTGASQVVKFTYNNGSDTDVTVSLPTASAVDSKISAHAEVTGNGSSQGHLKLSNAIDGDNIDTGSGIAATPLAVYLALSAAKAYTDAELLKLPQPMVFKGTIGDIQAGATYSNLPKGGDSDPYQAGWTYMVAKDGTYAGYTCEAGDMIVAVKATGLGSAVQNTDWAVVQKNIDGAVTADANFAEDALIVGGGSNRTVKKLANGTVGQVLTTNSDGKPEWAKASVSSSNINGVVAIANGGTGANSAAGARTNLGLGDAAVKGVALSLTENGADLPTAGVVYAALQSATQSAAPEWEELT